MAYGASAYGYITGADLELAMRLTLTTGIYAYAEPQVVAQISLAERMVNSVCGTTYTGTIPDNIIAATTIIAKKLMENVLIEDGKMKKDLNNIERFPDTIREILDNKKYQGITFVDVSI